MNEERTSDRVEKLPRGTVESKKSSLEMKAAMRCIAETSGDKHKLLFIGLTISIKNYRSN